MNKKIAPVLIIVLIVLQVISVIRIGYLQNDLNNINNQLTNLISEQSNQINNIYSNIDTMLNRQSSIIDSYDYLFGTADIDKLTIPVTFNITPKETKEDTVATLYISGESVIMNKNGTTFTATLPAKIFDTFEASVVLNDSGVQKTEKLDISENLRDKVFPIVNVRVEGESGIVYNKKPGEMSGEYHRKGNLNIDVKPAANNTVTIVKFSLVCEVDGNIVSEKPIDNTTSFAIDEKYTLSAGQTLTMTVAATDSFGFIHKSIVDKFALDKNADPVKDIDRFITEDAIITDKDGKILYDPQYQKVS
jgi:hypothetical protein